MGRILKFFFILGWLYTFSVQAMELCEVEAGCSESQKAKRKDIDASPSLSKRQKVKKVRFNLATPPSLEEEIECLHAKVSSALDNARLNTLQYAFNRFSEMDFSEEEWEKLAQSLSADRWRDQKTWKQVVGGHLFFPWDTFTWENIPWETFRLQRSAHLWAYAYSAKFFNPLGFYYLAHQMQSIRTLYTDEPFPFFEKIKKYALDVLSEPSDSPEACYIIGTECMSGPNPSPQSAMEWHLQGGDDKNCFKYLMAKAHVLEEENLWPGIEDLATLARSGFWLAGLEHVAPSIEEEIAFLTEASQHLPQARIPLAILYNNLLEVDKEKEQLNLARKEGVTEAALLLAFQIVGDPRNAIMKLEGLSQEKIDEAMKLFIKAGKKHNPEGWYWAAHVLEKKYQKELQEKKEEVPEKLIHEKSENTSGDSEEEKVPEKSEAQKKHEYLQERTKLFRESLYTGYYPSAAKLRALLIPKKWEQFENLFGKPHYNGLEFEFEKFLNDEVSSFQE